MMRSAGMMRHSSAAALGILVFLAIWLHIATTASGAEDPDSAGIRYSDGRLSVELQERSLFEVLRNLSQEIGVEIEIVTGTDRPVSVAFSDMPLEEGVKILLSPQSSVFVYRGGKETEKDMQLEKIIIFGNGDTSFISSVAGQSPSLVPPAAGENQTTGQAVNGRGTVPPSLTELAARLQSPDPDLRMDALSDIAADHAAEALQYLEKGLTQDGNDEVRVSAAELLGDIDSEASVSVLAKGLRDPDEDVRRAVIEALGFIGGAKVLPVLKSALQEKNSDIREDVEILIQEIEDEEKGGG